MAEQKPAVEIDSCVEVDESEVENLVDLELHAARSRRQAGPISVRVRCLDGAQEIRVEPWASLSSDGIRTLQLPAVDDAALPAREARSRELALAIAELIRRLEITQPLRATAPPPDPPPPPPPRVQPVLSAPAVAEEPRHRWLVGVSSSYEAFTGGQRMAGGGIALAVRLRRWILAEVRVGGRVVDGQTSPLARLTGRAGTAAVAAGPSVWSKHLPVGFAFLLCAQGYAIQYLAQPPGDGASRTARLGAITIAVAPRLLIAVSRRISVTAEGGVGIPLHGIVVRTQGMRTDSLSGVAVSGSLGAVVTF